MPSYSKESFLLSYANAKHFLLLKKKSCGKVDIKRLILKCRSSSSAYSTVWVNSKICRRTDFINLLTYVLCFSARMFGIDARLLS